MQKREILLLKNIIHISVERYLTVNIKRNLRKEILIKLLAEKCLERFLFCTLVHRKDQN